LSDPRDPVADYLFDDILFLQKHIFGKIFTKIQSVVLFCR